MPGPARVSLPGTLRLTLSWTAAEHLHGYDLCQARASLVPLCPLSTPHCHIEQSRGREAVELGAMPAAQGPAGSIPRPCQPCQPPPGPPLLVRPLPAVNHAGLLLQLQGEEAGR